MAPDPLALQIAANRRAATQVRARVLAFVSSSWWALGAWNVPDIDRFVALVLPAVLAGQRSIAQLTDHYLGLVALRHGYELVDTLDVDQVTGQALRGVDPEIVYRRGGAEVWGALAAGEPLEVAVERGAARLASVTATDLQLAKTHTARQVLGEQPADRRPTGFVRTLEGTSSCGFCALASTRLYHVEDLLPIHPGCDCDVEPYYGDQTLVVEPAQLERVHALARDFFGTSRASGFDRSSGELDYHDFVIVHEHGELGPVLARQGQHFQGPEQQ